MRLTKYIIAGLTCFLLILTLLSGCADTAPTPTAPTSAPPTTAPTVAVTEPDESVIAKNAYNGSDMKSFTLEPAVRYIDEGAFANCPELRNFYCRFGDATIHENAFSGSENVIFHCYLNSRVDLFAREQGYKRVYYDAFSIRCDTVYNGCVGLPITWRAVDVMRGEKLESQFVYTLYVDGTPVFTSEPTTERSFTYTPTAGGMHTLSVQILNSLTQTTVTAEAVSVADQLLLGHYEQDDEDEAPEPIQWRILTVEDGKALVLSEYVLTRGSYFNPEWIKYKYTYWSHSCIGATSSTNYWGSQPEAPERLMSGLNPQSVPQDWYGERGPETDLFYLHARYWCNDVFYKDAFSPEEKTRILLSDVTNSGSPFYNIKGGPDTQDHVFFLSYDEIAAYLPTSESREAFFTTHCDNLPVEYGGTAVYYWLRTPGRWQVNAMFIYGVDGCISYYGSDVGHNMIGYRPAMWIVVGG